MLEVPIDIAGERFRTKKALTERVRAVLHGGDAPRRLDADEETLIGELLKFHPDAPTKVGCGVGHIEIRWNPPYHSRGFWVVRLDGSATDFSYIDAIKADKHTQRERLIDACRFAVRPVLRAFAEEFFAQAQTPTCPILGVPLDPTTAHVDHAPPYTFLRIFESFVLLNGLNVDDVSLTDHSTDGVLVPLFKNTSLRDRFVAYHHSVALLRVISPEANQTTIPAYMRAS